MMDREALNLASLGADILLKATLLLGLAGVGRLLLRRASASLRQIIGVLALGGILMLPLLTPVMPDWKVPVVPAVFIAPAAETEPARGWTSAREPLASRATATKATNEPGAKKRGAALASETVSEAPADFGYGVIREPEVQPVAPRRASWSLPSAAALASVFLALWAAVAAALLLRLSAGIVRVFRYGRAAETATEPKWIELVHELSAKLGLKRVVRLKFTDDVAVAVTAGFFRPILLLPTSARRWSPELRRVVLLHELAHVRRGDWFALLLAETAAAIYWLNPLVWLSVRQLRSDCEQAADDFVLRSGTKASVYAGHLLGIIRSLRHPAPPPLPAMGVARPSQFEARLKAILDPNSPRKEASTGQLRMAASFAAGAVLVLGALEPWKSIAAEVPTSDDSTASISSGKSCDSDKKENEKPESRPALRADHYGDGDFVEVSASDSEPFVEEAEAEIAHGEDDPATPPETGSAVPAIWEGEKEQKEGFVRASRKNPRTGSDWYGRGMELHQDGDYDAAIAAFAKAIELGHREDAASYNIACGYALKGDKDHAFKWLDRAMAAGFDISGYMGHDDDLDGLKSDPRFAQYRQKAKSEVREARRAHVERKLARLEEATRSDPKNGAAFYKLGYELYESGEHARAAKAFRQAAELGYREATSLYNTACMLSLDGDKRGALDYLERSVLAGFGSADKLREDDDLDNIRSEPRYRELIKLAEDLELPDLPQRGWHDKWGARSSRVRRTQEWREAADEIQVLTQKHPRIGRVWFNLGFARLEAGQPEEGVRAFEKALELNHRRPTTMYNLACSYSLLDRKDQAFDWLFKAIEAGFDSSGMLRSDDDLDNLRGDPRYRQALKLAQKHDRDHDDEHDD